ncbi:unnamed protein product [Rhizophagus irregularis]|uniref:Uncharacterized protein n=1 Tax=Rhizophagus irregularis TaxID=588596 RepID=A0A915ZMP4_9GLOM|nr:unnamed protein product [Rhizophagus irregularis]
MLRSIENFINCPVFIKSGSFSELLVLSSANCGSFPQSNHFRENISSTSDHSQTYIWESPIARFTEIVHCVAKLEQKLPISRHIFDAYLTSL